MEIHVNKKYNYFDDGKIHKNRMYKVKITKVILFDKADIEVVKKWKKEVKDDFFSAETDYFVHGVVEDIDEELIFCRTVDGGWFSFNSYLYDGRLDFNGKLEKELKKREDLIR